MIFMSDFGYDRASPIEKALKNISMQVLVERKARMSKEKFRFYSRKMLSNEVILGVEKSKIRNVCRMLLGSLLKHSGMFNDGSRMFWAM